MTDQFLISSTHAGNKEFNLVGLLSHWGIVLRLHIEVVQSGPNTPTHAPPPPLGVRMPGL